MTGCRRVIDRKSTKLSTRSGSRGVGQGSRIAGSGRSRAERGIGTEPGESGWGAGTGSGREVWPESGWDATGVGREGYRNGPGKRGRGACAPVKQFGDMRKILTAGLERAAGEAGYAFYSGFGYRCGGTVCRFPAVWLMPPRLTEAATGDEGEALYRVEMVLMAAGAGVDGRGRERVWNRLERDALSICRRLARTAGVVRVWAAECGPGECPMTAAGEVSLKVSFRVSLFFRADDCGE